MMIEGEDGVGDPGMGRGDHRSPPPRRQGPAGHVLLIRLLVGQLLRLCLRLHLCLHLLLHQQLLLVLLLPAGGRWPSCVEERARLCLYPICQKCVY